MSRRPTTARRPADGGSIPFVGSFHPKSRPPVSIGRISYCGTAGCPSYIYHGSGGRYDLEAFNRLEGNFCS
ncbi:hypothetical protein Leryth_007205 [Lithospermum erythrorhizon]|nr:hypothetical protein Leryth_007205 [Lithospermum erythrorhizon]